MDSITFLKQFNLTDEERNLVLQLGTPISFEKGEDLSLHGKVAQHFYFMQSGLIRSYRLLDGDDFTYNFFMPGNICVDFESILTQEPSQHFFEVLSPAKVLKFSWKEFEKLFENHPRIERIARKMSEEAYLHLLSRVRDFQSDTLEQRYLKLIEHNEEIFQQAPLQHIASYLGVKPQSLSRIRAKIAGK